MKSKIEYILGQINVTNTLAWHAIFCKIMKKNAMFLLVMKIFIAIPITQIYKCGVRACLLAMLYFKQLNVFFVSILVKNQPSVLQTYIQ
jgi:hypothetical protein